MQAIVVVKKSRDSSLEYVLKEGARRGVGVHRVTDVVVNVSGADGGAFSVLVVVEECVEEIASKKASCA